MALGREERVGLSYLKNLMRFADLPGDAKLRDIFFQKEGDTVSPIFSDNATVADIMKADLNGDRWETDVLFAAGTAYYMWHPKPENTMYFLESPDGSGRIPINEVGLASFVVDGKLLSKKDTANYTNLQKDLGDFLSTFQEEKEGVYKTVKGDLRDKEVWARLLHKDKRGKFAPIPIDPEKLSSEMKQDRLQVLADVEKYFKADNLYVRDEDGTISKVGMTKDRTIYRGDFERDALEAVVRKESPDAHGSVAMFLMRLLQSIGIHWFDDMIEEQEKIEAWRAQRMEQRRSEKQKITNTMELGAEQMMPAKWDAGTAIEKTMVDPKSALGKELGGLKGMAYTYKIMGLLAGVLAEPEDMYHATKLLDGLTSGEAVWKDPEMKKFLKRGFDRYEEAYYRFEKTAIEEADPEPLKKLMRAAVKNIRDYATRLVPLDKRAIMLAKVAKGFTDYVKQVPALSDAFHKEVKTMRGIFALGQLVGDGLTAQYELANNLTDPRNVMEHMRDLMAYKTAEEFIALSNALAMKQTEPRQNEAAGQRLNFLDLLGEYGIEPFEYILEKSEFAEKLRHATSEKDRLDANREAAELAREGLRNGHNSTISANARTIARALPQLYMAWLTRPVEKVKGPFDDRLVVYGSGAENRKQEEPSAPQKSF